MDMRVERWVISLEICLLGPVYFSRLSHIMTLSQLSPVFFVQRCVINHQQSHVFHVAKDAARHKKNHGTI